VSTNVAAPGCRGHSRARLRHSSAIHDTCSGRCERRFETGLAVATRTITGIRVEQALATIQAVSSVALNALAVVFVTVLVMAIAMFILERSTPGPRPVMRRGCCAGIKDSAVLIMLLLAGVDIRMPSGILSRPAAALCSVSSAMMTIIITAVATVALQSAASFIAVSGFSDLSGKTVVMPRATTAEQYLAAHSAGHTLRSTDTLDEALSLFQDGTGDAMVYDKPILTSFVARDQALSGRTRFAVVGEVFERQQYGIAAHKGLRPGVLESLNRAILSVYGTDEVAELRQKWLGGTPSSTEDVAVRSQSSVTEFLSNNFWAIAFLVFSVIGFALLVGLLAFTIRSACTLYRRRDCSRGAVLHGLAAMCLGAGAETKASHRNRRGSVGGMSVHSSARLVKSRGDDDREARETAGQGKTGCCGGGGKTGSSANGGGDAAAPGQDRGRPCCRWPGRSTKAGPALGKTQPRSPTGAFGPRAGVADPGPTVVIPGLAPAAASAGFGSDSPRGPLGSPARDRASQGSATGLRLPSPASDGSSASTSHGGGWPGSLGVADDGPAAPSDARDTGTWVTPRGRPQQGAGILSAAPAASTPRGLSADTPAATPSGVMTLGLGLAAASGAADDDSGGDMTARPHHRRPAPGGGGSTPSAGRRAGRSPASSRPRNSTALLKPRKRRSELGAAAATTTPRAGATRSKSPPLLARHSVTAGAAAADPAFDPVAAALSVATSHAAAARDAKTSDGGPTSAGARIAAALIPRAPARPRAPQAASASLFAGGGVALQPSTSVGSTAGHSAKPPSLAGIASQASAAVLDRQPSVTSQRGSEGGLSEMRWHQRPTYAGSAAESLLPVAGTDADERLFFKRMQWRLRRSGRVAPVLPPNDLLWMIWERVDQMSQQLLLQRAMGRLDVPSDLEELSPRFVEAEAQAMASELEMRGVESGAARDAGMMAAMAGTDDRGDAPVGLAPSAPGGAGGKGLGSGGSSAANRGAVRAAVAARRMRGRLSALRQRRRMRQLTAAEAEDEDDGDDGFSASAFLASKRRAAAPLTVSSPGSETTGTVRVLPARNLQR